jgi:hypothetical protein
MRWNKPRVLWRNPPNGGKRPKDRIRAKKTGLSDELDGPGGRMGCAVAILALAACGTGPAPNDVSEGVGFQDYQEYQARRTPLMRTPTPVAPQTALPPAEVVAEPFSNQPAASQWVSVDPATATPTGSVDVARDRRRRHRRGRGNAPRTVCRRSDPEVPFDPTQMATAPTGDDFVAPPLPEGMSVVAPMWWPSRSRRSTTVGERVYPRFPVRLGRPEVRCRDFRTTDLAQDWFLTNDGPERDRAGLDPDGDGFACNWTPERYREEARAATQPQTFGTLQDG